MASGIEVIRWLQQASPALDGPFRAITALGGASALLLLVSVIHWCVDRRTGARLAILVLVSAWLNAWAKLLFDMPRPTAVSDGVQALVHASGNGFPSGHTQITVVFWGYLAALGRRSWLYALAASLMLLVPLSRVYLGVHFPVDVAGGYALGAVVLTVFWLTAPRVGELIAHGGARVQAVLVVAAAGSMAAVTWPDPYAVGAAGGMLGIGAGLTVQARWIAFEAAGSLRRRAVRALIGAAVLFGLSAALEWLLAGRIPDAAAALLRYAAIGAWIAAGAPWLFVQTGLTARERRTAFA